jgi:hypothetical protein
MDQHEPRQSWHDDVFFGLHYDLHANATDTVLGKELTAEHLRERLGRVMPDWVQCDCKGHAGYKPQHIEEKTKRTAEDRIMNFEL